MHSEKERRWPERVWLAQFVGISGAPYLAPDEQAAKSLSSEPRVETASYVPEAGLQELASAVKQHRNATESRLRLLAAGTRQPESSDCMLKPDRDLYEALDSLTKEGS